MTFVRKRQLLRLTFAEGHELHGLEVVTRPPNVDQVIGIVGELGQLGDLVSLIQPGEDLTPEALNALSGLKGKIEPLYEALAEALVSWNYVLESLDGGEDVPVPATAEGLRQMEGNDRTVVLKAWLKQVTPPAEDSDLGKGSPSGVIFPEASLPMAPLSASPLSLSVPA